MNLSMRQPRSKMTVRRIGLMAVTYPLKLVRRTTKRLGAVLCVLAFSGPGFAQDLGAVMDQLERLERDIRTLNIQISRGRNEAGAKTPISATGDKKIPGAGVVRITQRLDNLEQDIRSATGSMEQLGHQIFQLTERLEKLVGDVDFRLSALETKMDSGPSAALSQAAPPGAVVLETSTGPAGVSAVTISGAPVSKVSVTAAAPSPAMPTQGPQTLDAVSAKAVEAVRQQTPQAAATGQQSTPPVATQVATSTPLPAGTPKEQYTFALNLLRQTNYDQAEIALTEFIAIQGKHPLTGNARYWLGETYYVRADYEQAAQTFFQGYQASPSNVKAPDMLLKLGMSLAQLKKKTEACATFNKLSQDFPRASTRIISAVARERKRADC
jgi:tol-pal system protein YbgF